MASFSYLRRIAEKRKKHGRIAGLASARSRAAHRISHDVAMRETRVAKITIEDSHRHSTVVVLRREHRDGGRWSRWHLDGYDAPALAATGIGKLLARLLD